LVLTPNPPRVPRRTNTSSSAPMQVGPTSPTPLARRRMGGAGTPRLGRRSGTPSCRRAGNGTVSHRISAHPLIGAWKKTPSAPSRSFRTKNVCSGLLHPAPRSPVASRVSWSSSISRRGVGPTCPPFVVPLGGRGKVCFTPTRLEHITSNL
jgi:hypothetical protein